MKVIQISEKLYDRLKSCVVDPFDDTPESVIHYLIEIVNRAKREWCPFDVHMENGQQQEGNWDTRPERAEHRNRQVESARREAGGGRHRALKETMAVLFGHGLK